MDTLFKLQHLELIAEFSEALFLSRLKASYRVNHVLDDSLVHYCEFLKATCMWSGSQVISMQ